MPSLLTFASRAVAPGTTGWKRWVQYWGPTKSAHCGPTDGICCLTANMSDLGKQVWTGRPFINYIMA